MTWLGLLLPIAYIPGITGAAIATQWAVLSLALPLLLWKTDDSSLTCLHYLGAVFLSWTVLGLLWSPQVLTAIFGLWIVILWGLSFHLGFRTANPRLLFLGLALGLYINVAIAIAQAFGWEGVRLFSIYPAGLLYNSTLFGACCALVAIGLVQHRLYIWALPLLLGVALSHSFGALLILIVALASILHWALPLTAFAIVPFVLNSLSDSQRLQIWGAFLHGLTPRGWAAGSADLFWYTFPNGNVHPEYAHNDYLQLIFEFGIPACIPFAILAAAFIWRRTPLLFACTALAGFYFPLYTPITGFIFCFAMGYSLRGFSLDGLILRRCRPDLLPRLPNQQPITSIPWRTYLPFLPRIARS